MSTDVSKAPLDGQEATGISQASESSRPHPAGEGLGVFRGLLLMVLFYIAIGFLGWFAWNAFRHWHAH
jgi:hypothetical protein